MPTKRVKPAKAAKPAKPAKTATPAAPTAEVLAAKQKDISISEFFSKNRHLLGFDNPRRALLSAVKEAVDNSLDACEESRILPEIKVVLKNLENNRMLITVRDNGPGIVKAQIPKIFGKLLYGSKFHTLKMSRGQQGIGISAAGMYGQLTTGKPMNIISRTEKKKPAQFFSIFLNTQKNQPDILKEEEMDWDQPHGTEIDIELEGKYLKGRQSVDDYLQQTAIANPHAQIEYQSPEDKPVIYKRAAHQLPPPPKEIKPHPYGVELGRLMAMLKTSKSRSVKSFLSTEFSRLSSRTARDILRQAQVSEKMRPVSVDHQEAEKIYQTIQQTKIMKPTMDCIVPIGEKVIIAGLKAQIPADFYWATTRPPEVYRGNPFVIEAGLAYGGSLPAEELMTVYRLANRVPLQYQQGACAIFKTVLSMDWKNYRLQQSKGALPAGPVVVLVHMASVWVPFTSESKEAVAGYDVITKEIRLALQELGRQLGLYLSRRHRALEEERKRSYIEKYLPHVAIGLGQMLKLKQPEEKHIVKVLTALLEKERPVPNYKDSYAEV